MFHRPDGRNRLLPNAIRTLYQPEVKAPEARRDVRPMAENLWDGQPHPYNGTTRRRAPGQRSRPATRMGSAHKCLGQPAQDRTIAWRGSARPNPERVSTWHILIPAAAPCGPGRSGHRVSRSSWRCEQIRGTANHREISNQSRVSRCAGSARGRLPPAAHRARNRGAATVHVQQVDRPASGKTA